MRALIPLPALAVCVTVICAALAGCHGRQKPPLAAAAEPASPAVAEEIVVKRFDIKTEVRGNEVSVWIDTDLPASTELTMRIARSYWRHDHGEAVEYSVEYGRDRHITAAQAARPITADISDIIFNRRLAEVKENAAILREKFTLDRVAADITIQVTMGSPQKAPFALKNTNLSGADVRKLSDFLGLGIEKSVNLVRPLGFHDLLAERQAHDEAARRPFPEIADTLVPRLVLAALPAILARSLSNPEYADTETPLDRSGTVQNDLNEPCAYTQQTIKGVRYFYQPPPGVVAENMAVLTFKDRHCMRAHIPSVGLTPTANHVNFEIAKAWLSAPEQSAFSVPELKMPQDQSAQGLCLRSRASAAAYALVQYVISDGAIVSVLHTFGGAPDGCGA